MSAALRSVDSTAEPLTVHEAFAAVMDEVQAVGKDGRNTSQDYAFRGIDGVMNAVGPALRKHGVIIVPSVLESNYRDVEVGRNRTLMREVTVTVEYTIYGPKGDTIVGRVSGESMDSGDKGTAKAFSVAYRTFLLQALTIPTHQPDPDEQSYERSAAAPEPPAAWTEGMAKQHVLNLREGDRARAAEAWPAIKTAEWTADSLTAAFAAWVNADPADRADPVPEGDAQ